MKNRKIIALLLIIVFSISIFSFPVFAQASNSNLQSVIETFYTARNNNQFGKFINSFYFADLISEEDKAALSQTFYNERINYGIEPVESKLIDNSTGEFTYFEISRIKGNNNRFALSTSKVKATLKKNQTGWKIYDLNYIQSYPLSIPQDIVNTFYTARNNKDFDKYLNSFYYADLLDEATINSMKDTFYINFSFTVNYSIEPIDLIVKDSNNVEFVYDEIQTVTNGSAKLVIKTKVSAYLKKKNSEWKIESFNFGTSTFEKL
ncbi:MAG TPA: hypothetical protein PK566_04020 [Pseudobacteroides sp.]|nr:hypothetical protein [Pseudobacteroides sp.]